MLGFLVDIIYVVFGDHVFQQFVGIPMSTKLYSSIVRFFKGHICISEYKIATLTVCKT
jgi:hypothetical protein